MSSRVIRSAAPRMMRERLSASELGIRRTNRASRCKDRPVTFQHDESCILIGKPTQRGERYHSVRTGNDKAAKSMSDAWEPDLVSVRSDPIRQNQMAVVNADLDAVTEKSHDAVTWC